MFRGRFRHTIDEKGRLSIPSKFREILNTNYDERLIVTNFDGCLWGYPVSEWQALEQKVSALPQFLEEVKALQRVFISAAVECPLDKSGRILLPPELRQYAGIEKELVIVGMTKRIELWSAEKWEEVFHKAQNTLEGLGLKLADLGL
ncbi:MAG: division/cell wall cluster transcriptional repressor MraZ [Deltaproteobacteria bacterium CG_4_10_14_0_2_um_filter_43_8]|nr:MAG: division/cell wall cluster transcriptional repressor MraZ [Deltaproteobacteria bacterium CG11_big_fil_rev_8_21_14_0_20_42_23]PJA18364.1 MAG: division/cell wall cluster transcriptional repressor MraZ [Deltaproteobacteria bacterium CG_4_10_14_0_2_um_filter_43_8]PJC65107.1 MAG: division/cell wall cluster transcriptional repressor MraZ [Deltaproteobacteria bacterium CG_4_9_14_0_2_um_filter_42_21]